jgi:predicted nucleic acid-binding protein
VRAVSTGNPSMSVETRFTLDTNILVYSIDSKAGLRHELAAEMVDRAADHDCWLTLQAISEFYVAVTRKGVMPASAASAQAADWLTTFPHAAASPSSVRSALSDAAAGRASYWDALLLATAAEAGCGTVLTEDLKDGARIGGSRVHHPFAREGGLTQETRRLLGLA